MKPGTCSTQSNETLVAVRDASAVAAYGFRGWLAGAPRPTTPKFAHRHMNRPAARGGPC